MRKKTEEILVKRSKDKENAVDFEIHDYIGTFTILLPDHYNYIYIFQKALDMGLQLAQTWLFRKSRKPSGNISNKLLTGSTSISKCVSNSRDIYDYVVYAVLSCPFCYEFMHYYAL